MTPKELCAQIHASLDDSIPSLGVSCTPSAEPGMLLLAANLTGGMRFKANAQSLIHVRFRPGQEVAARNELLRQIHIGVTQSDQQRVKHNRDATRREYTRTSHGERAAVN
jgi:hypothetical protein